MVTHAANTVLGIPSAASRAAPTPVYEPRVFARLRLRLWRNQLHSLLLASRFRFVMVVLCSALFWCGLFAVFFEAFEFLGRYLNTDQIGSLFSAFFLSLFVMLAFSGGIIAYGGLYPSSEAAFLLTMPARADHVFAHKFHDVMLFSSWGFLLLGSPMMIAFSISVDAPWTFYGFAALYLIAFVHLPTSIGAAACILIAHYFPRRRLSLLVALASGVLVLAGLWTAGMFRGSRATFFSDAWVGSVLDRMQLFRAALLPSWWMSTGLLSAARGEWDRALFYVLLILANGMFFYLIATAVAARWYRDSYSRVHTGSPRRRAARRSAFDRWFRWVLPARSPGVGLLVAKDLITFRRDPVQWSQFLIYVGLLGSYFFMYPQFGGQIPGYPRYAISFLNLAVAALVLSTFTTRFVFPMLSLEGRNLWILGLAPVRREAILWSKFAFAAGGTILPTVALVVLSDLSLSVPAPLLAVHLTTMVLLCIGLAGLSVGLGARLPNFKEENPSKIAAGFGGTLNLLLSTVYVFGILVLLTLPAHIYLASIEMERNFSLNLGPLSTRGWMTLGMIGGAALSAAATILPLRMGLKAFRRMEV